MEVVVSVILTIAVCLTGIQTVSCQGPICFACNRTENPEDCRTHVTCGENQVCSVQEVSLPHGDVYFWSGCEDVETCDYLSDQLSSSSIIGRRQTSVSQQRCLYCCSSDLCNRNCTSFVNLALHRPAYESSVNGIGSADLAVDGDTNKDFFSGKSCMHTISNEHYSWWAVDLGREFHITKVKIHERGDAGADGRNFHLLVLASSVNATKLDRTSTLFTKCGAYFGHSSEGNTIVIDCPRSTTGRWIRVQQNDPHIEYLHLCEVEVFGF
ncbi:fucolectin-5-like [Mya arenaria]|uniref:fucolectin-5-like n=1 Tax=Mya arenaria TaxID=6604 RepID=UPI0022E98F36|nr:fucolectin-5-like [Mya arenaria]